MGGEAESLDADGVVLCLFRKSREKLYRELRDRLPRVLRIGDAEAPQPVEAVIYGAELLGRSI